MAILSFTQARDSYDDLLKIYFASSEIDGTLIDLAKDIEFMGHPQYRIRNDDHCDSEIRKLVRRTLWLESYEREALIKILESQDGTVNY